MANIVTCPNCQSEVVEDSEYCSWCGEGLPPQRGSRGVWSWLGVWLLACCAIFWLLVLIIMAADPEDWLDLLIGGAIISVVPILLGIFLMKRRLKHSISLDNAAADRYRDSGDDRRYR